MRRDPLPINTHFSGVTPPVDMSDSNAVYIYTDDLLTIHDQLVTIAAQRQKLNSSAEVLCARVRQAFREYFGGNLLEAWNEGKAEEPEAQLIIAAHNRVITLFHSLWGVLPSRELDDYRVTSVEPYSLSEDFLDEALFGILETVKGKDSFAHGARRAKADTHESKGQFTYPVWVGPIPLLYKIFEGRVGSKDDKGNIHLDCFGPFKGGRNVNTYEGAWVIDDIAYVNAEFLDIRGPGWANVVGYTMAEIEELYDKRTNSDD